MLKHSPDACCTAATAWAWVEELLVFALGGDPDAVRCLPEAVQHYLEVRRHAHAS